MGEILKNYLNSQLFNEALRIEYSDKHKKYRFRSTTYILRMIICTNYFTTVIFSSHL